MPKARLGEREIIRFLTAWFSTKYSLPLGFNDDVASLSLSRDKWAILKSDMLVGSTDIPPGMSLRQAARKSIVGTVSDFAAKGVRPKALLVSLGLKKKFANISVINQLGRGFSDAAREYGCKIVGGDTSQAEDLVIDIIGFGLANPNLLIRRNGSKPGDVVVVTGEFGKTAAGLRILVSRKDHRVRWNSLTRSVLHPVARLETGVILAKSGAVTSSIDSSDGLAWSLYELARSSRVNVRIEKIPIARDAMKFARERKLDAAKLALYGGEEYEIVATVRPDKYRNLRKMVPSLRRIGMIEPGNGQVSALTGEHWSTIEPVGWDHFKT